MPTSTAGGKPRPIPSGFPNGETLDEVRARALEAVEAVVQRHPGQVVFLAAHRAVNKVLIAAFIGLDNSHFWRIGQDTTAINRFTPGGGHLAHYGRKRRLSPEGP